MPELVEQMYCSQQIVIPPKFPYTLKRYCKAAIKTQPYDLLRWSMEYFRALADHRPPPVKLRLEWPTFNTDGGLTKGCLKVIANQLRGMSAVRLLEVKQSWRGFCLSPVELARILCLCEVYMREETVPFLHFIAVAAGLLTKTLTHTMLLLCDTLTHEPDGGSAAIPLEDMLTMYKYLAQMDASKDVKYFDGYREGHFPPKEELTEDSIKEEEVSLTSLSDFDDDFWPVKELEKLPLVNDYVSKTQDISMKLAQPLIGKLERTVSLERAADLEKKKFSIERKGRPDGVFSLDRDSDEVLIAAKTPEGGQGTKVIAAKDIEIDVFDEDGTPMPFTFYGEPIIIEVKSTDKMEEEEENKGEECKEEAALEQLTKKQIIEEFVQNLYADREARRDNLARTMDEIASIVDRFNNAYYDLGMIAGRQMSITSGELIVQYIEKEIMDYINDQIAILPDPDLKKKKATAEEVKMVRALVEEYIDENMEIFVPDIVEEDVEAEPVPTIISVYAVPGIGPPVDEDIIRDFVAYMTEVSHVQADLVMPRNIRHFMCPPLEKCQEHNYNMKEEDNVPFGGSMTD